MDWQGNHILNRNVETPRKTKSLRNCGRTTQGQGNTRKMQTRQKNKQTKPCVNIHTHIYV